MIIAVASGKGGTGKTTVATSLALSITTTDVRNLADRSADPANHGSEPGEEPLFLDCDVEEPNAALFLKPTLNHHEEVGILIPEVDYDRCTFCGRCAEVCVWHAIAVVGRKVLVFPELCHGCGSCAFNCREGAIHEVLHVMGSLELGQAGSIAFGHGILNVGEAMAVPIIRQLKAKRMAPLAGRNRVTILDASPGTSCPVVETMRGADFVLLVTEPTPFGLHDLRLTVQVARDQLGLPVGVVVNRDGVDDASVDTYCAAEGIPIMMRIPLDRRIAEAISGGKALVEALPEYRPWFAALYEWIAEEVASRKEAR
jgi:MinD superfamily P-loop ATPase